MNKIMEFWNKNIFTKIVTICIALIIISSIGNAFDDNESNNSGDDSDKTKLESKNQVELIDFSTMSIGDITTWCETNNLNCYKKDEYSDTVAKGLFVSQSIKNGEKTNEGSTIDIIYSLGKKPSLEYQNALTKAESYSNTMHMSKQGIYDQLISEYGEQFPADAAQYAVDNMVADFKVNALAKAKSYQQTMSMSKNAIYDQLISQYGEKFTTEEAQYAIDNLDN